MNTKESTVILVIDDDPAVRAVTVIVLGSFGFKNILQADSGEEGIEMISDHFPDLVITDRTMPGMQGEEVIAWVVREHKPRFPKIKIIALSGDREEEVKPVVMAAGGDGFLHKPFNPQDLRSMVEGLLA